MRIELQHLPADVLGLAPWARATLATRPRPPGLPGLLVPERLESIPRLAPAADPEARQQLARVLERALSAYQPHVAVLDSVRALAEPAAMLVVAGQQPGFLGGPLYDVYKALHAIRLARALSVFFETPVLPAFWNHSDDHDIAEVHHLWLQNPNLDLFKVGMAGVSSGRTPLARIRFDAERHRLRATEQVLRQNLPPGPERNGAIELFLPRAGETFSGAFTRVLLELFGAHGLIVLEPEWIREPLSRALADLVSRGLPAALQAGARQLCEAGTEPPIDPRTAVLAWHSVEERRFALRSPDGDYAYDGEAGSRSAAELAAEILQDPGAWSAGALVRPLLQDRVLPVVAYVGGWGELHYHAQLPAARAALGVPSPAFVPRFSATLVEPETRAALAKLGLDVRDVLERRAAPEVAAVATAGSALAGRLRRAAAEASARLLSERAALSEIERGLAHQLKRAADTVEGLVDRIATKVERVEANARGTDQRSQRRVANALLPRDTPQERVRGALEFVARHGRVWLDLLLEELEPLPTEHWIVNLVDEDAT
jgi:bacillithiol biosynthesis cysteine-adding enzyme BshC